MVEQNKNNEMDNVLKSEEEGIDLVKQEDADKYEGLSSHILLLMLWRFI